MYQANVGTFALYMKIDATWVHSTPVGFEIIIGINSSTHSGETQFQVANKNTSFISFCQLAAIF